MHSAMGGHSPDFMYALFKALANFFRPFLVLRALANIAFF